MNCLTEEQLVRVAWDLEADGGQAHVAACAECGGRAAELQALEQRLSAAHARFDHNHEPSRAELLRLLAGNDRAAESIPAGRRLITLLGGLSMRRKAAWGGIGAAMLIAAVILWSTNSPGRVSAMEHMARGIRQAKSYAMTMEIEFKVGETGKTRASSASQKFYWEAPHSIRMELDSKQPVSPGVTTEIYPTGKAGIEISHTRKEYQRKPPRLGQLPPLLMLDGLSRYTGQADRELGVKQIDGHSVRGFEIDAKKIDPDAYSGPVEVWLDEKTNLPVRIRYEPKATPPGILTMRDFRWNTEFDPKLFDTTPPTGYADVTRPVPGLEEQVREITSALATYAELAGKYPQAKVVYGDVTRDEMYRLLGIKDGMPTSQQTRSEKYAKVMRAMKGFATLSGGIFRESPDVAYYGLTVGPSDKEKVLLRWKLDDGRYQAIYGDLHDEIVSAERLRELESKE